MNIFKDQNGNWSSKRFFGAGLVVIGTALHTVLAIMAFKNPVADANTIVASANWLVGFGAGLLGISVFEFLKK